MENNFSTGSKRNNTMTNKYIIPAIIVVVLIGGFIYFVSANRTGQDAVTKKSMTDSAMEKEKDGAEMKGDAMMETVNPPPGSNVTPPPATPLPPPSGNRIDEPKPVQPGPQLGGYEEYSPAIVEAVQKTGNKVVLFFHAPWCPYCKAANTAFVNQESEIPSGVTVLKTDYDSNTELKKKYGVTYQHTFVQIDAQGNMVTKWNGGDIDSLKKNLK